MGKCLLATLYGGGLAADGVGHVGPRRLTFSCRVLVLIGSNTWWGGGVGTDFRQTKNSSFLFPIITLINVDSLEKKQTEKGDIY